MPALSNHLRKLADDEELALFYGKVWGQREVDPYDHIQQHTIRRDDSPHRIQPSVCEIPPQCLVFDAFDMASVHNLAHILVRQEYVQGLNVINEFSKRPRRALARFFDTSDDSEVFPPTFTEHFSMNDAGAGVERAGGVSVVGHPGIGTPQLVNYGIPADEKPRREILVLKIRALVSFAKS